MTRKPVTIIGAGRAGQRAVEILLGLGFDRILVVDPDPGRLGGIAPAVRTIQGEGVRWLAQDREEERGGEWIVPTLPLHLVHEWLLARLGPLAQRVAVPFQAVEGLPGAGRTTDGGFVLSKAQGLCPPDCDERKGCVWSPAGSATLPEMLEQRARDWPLETIRSRPLAPGLGGYPRSKLDRLLRRIESRQGRVMVATACRCHGVIHALKLNQGGDNDVQA